MSRYAERLRAAATEVVAFLVEMDDEFTGQEVMSILDAARFVVMANEQQQNRLGEDFVAEAGGEPEPEELARWEDDGGAVL